MRRRRLGDDWAARDRRTRVLAYAAVIALALLAEWGMCRTLAGNWGDFAHDAKMIN